MIGYIEWNSIESNDVERANITRCISKDGIYHLEFSNTELWSQGRIALIQTEQEQETKAMYMFTDNSYKGEAEVVGRVSRGKDTFDFTGTWHDPEDQTGVWDVYLECTYPDEYVFTYDPPSTDAPKIRTLD